MDRSEPDGVLSVLTQMGDRGRAADTDNSLPAIAYPMEPAGMLQMWRVRMRTDCAASLPVSAIASTAIGASMRGRDRSKKTAVAPRGRRLVRGIGEALLAVPASTWLLVDLTILTGATFTSYATFPPPLDPTTGHIVLWQASAVFAFAIIVAALVFGLNEHETLMSRSRILTRMLLTTLTASVLAYAIIYVLMYATVSRRATAMTMIVFLTSGAMIRLMAYWFAHQVDRALLVIGPRTLFESFQRAQGQGFLSQYRLAGYCTTHQRIDEDTARDPLHLGRLTDQLDAIASTGMTDLVVGKEAALDPNVMHWMVPCLQRGCRVTNEAIFYEKATGQILVDEITPSWFLFADLKVHCDDHATLKRLVDIVIASIGLCLTAPLWPLIALAVRLGDGGPAFHCQDRVGQNGLIFKLYKFRTMRVDAENGRSVWSSPNDPRVTYVGRFLRRSRFDELPQLYNVLMGQMSIVGPRPERPDIVKTLDEAIPFYDERHLVKPGITGWAQISFRYGASVEDSKRKLQFDLYYLKHMSFELDMMILFRTVSTFLQGAC